MSKLVRPKFDLWPLYRGERFRDRFWQWVKHKLDHVQCYRILVGPEIAIYYPDSCGGSLHHEDWWALVKPHELDDITERFASDEVGVHICKIKKMTAERWKVFQESVRNSNWNPLAMDESVSIPCRVCRSYLCCRSDKHLAGLLK